MNSISSQVVFSDRTKRLVLVTFLLLSSSLSCYADAPPNQCDIEAADPSDPNKKAPGKVSAAINSVTAVAACEAAVKQYPDEARFQAQMGRAYQVAKRDSEAVVWYQKAAYQGYPLAQVNLGSMYVAGTGIPKDVVKAVYWYRKAADQGYSWGQAGLGLMYRNGFGVPKDADKAIVLFKLAADQGNEFAKEEFDSLQKEIAISASWTSYSKRSKSTIEEILNYTTNGVEEGTAGDFWVSGLNGQHKCVLSRVLYSKAGDVIDVRQMNPEGVRISIDKNSLVTVGDERTKVSANYFIKSQPVMERLQKAWGLAFVECPSEVRRKF